MTQSNGAQSEYGQNGEGSSEYGEGDEHGGSWEGSGAREGGAGADEVRGGVTGDDGVGGEDPRESGSAASGAAGDIDGGSESDAHDPEEPAAPKEPPATKEPPASKNPAEPDSKAPADSKPPTDPTDPPDVPGSEGLTEDLFPQGVPRVSLRSSAELADALPYLLGFHPDDSVVVVALHGEHGRFGGRIRLGIPTEVEEWSAVAAQVAGCLESGSLARGERPDGALVFICQDPAEGESGADVMRRLRPLAQRLRLACGRLDMPVFEALCISDQRYFSYCCPDRSCCPPEGKPLAEPGTSAMAAAAAYMGVAKPSALRDLEARLAELGPPVASQQERALDAAGAELVPRMLGDGGMTAIRAETMTLAGALLKRFSDAPPRSRSWSASDAQDDKLLETDEAARVILGLQDRKTRDQAAEWIEGQDIQPAGRLWRALARRCVGPYTVHSAAPLTLAGWVSWSGGDGPAARVALSRALRADPGYVFAQLLQRACNEGVDPEPLRRSMRKERDARRAGRKRGSTGQVPWNTP